MKKAVGRPRDDSVDVKVVEAALDLLNDEGFSGLSIEGIASQAGVSKAAIYRRWDSKEELLVDAMASLVQEVEIPDSGDVRRDLITAINGMRRFVNDTRAGEVFPWLVGQIACQSSIGKRYAKSVIGPRRAMMASLIAHAVARGDLRSDLDIDLAVDVITGSVIIRKLTGQFDKTSDTWVVDLVDSILNGWLE